MENFLSTLREISITKGYQWDANDYGRIRLFLPRKNQTSCDRIDSLCPLEAVFVSKYIPEYLVDRSSVMYIPLREAGIKIGLWEYQTWTVVASSDKVECKFFSKETRNNILKALGLT